MKGENYLYFCSTTDEPNTTDEAILIPASAVRAIHAGIVNGTNGNSVTIAAEGFVAGDGNSRATLKLALIDRTNATFTGAMDDLSAAINATPGDGFTVIADAQNGVFCSKHIIGCTIDDAE